MCVKQECGVTLLQCVMGVKQECGGTLLQCFMGLKQEFGVTLLQCVMGVKQDCGVTVCYGYDKGFLCYSVCLLKRKFSHFLSKKNHPH